MDVDVIDKNQLVTVNDFHEIAIGPSTPETTRSRTSRAAATSRRVVEGVEKETTCRLPVFDL